MSPDQLPLLQHAVLQSQHQTCDPETLFANPSNFEPTGIAGVMATIRSSSLANLLPFHLLVYSMQGTIVAV